MAGAQSVCTQVARLAQAWLNQGAKQPEKAEKKKKRKVAARRSRRKSDRLRCFEIPWDASSILKSRFDTLQPDSMQFSRQFSRISETNGRCFLHDLFFFVPVGRLSDGF